MAIRPNDRIRISLNVWEERREVLICHTVWHIAYSRPWAIWNTVNIYWMLFFFMWVDEWTSSIFVRNSWLSKYLQMTDIHHSSIAIARPTSAIAYIFLNLTIFGRWALSIVRNTENVVIAGESKPIEASSWTHGELLLLLFSTLSCIAVSPESFDCGPLNSTTFSRRLYLIRSLFSILVKLPKRRPKHHWMRSNYADVNVIRKLIYDGPRK